MPTIIHFEISADDIDRARKFYEKLFGWKITVMKGFPDHYEIETTDLQGKKSVGGAISKRQQPTQKGIVNYIGVSSIDQSIAEVTALGGKGLQPKQAIPGYGYTALCIDTEGNPIGFFEDDKDAGIELMPDENTSDRYKAIKEQQTKL